MIVIEIVFYSAVGMLMALAIGFTAIGLVEQNRPVKREPIDRPKYYENYSKEEPKK